MTDSDLGCFSKSFELAKNLGGYKDATNTHEKHEKRGSMEEHLGLLRDVDC